MVSIQEKERNQLIPFTLEEPADDLTTYSGRFNSFRKT